MTKSSTLIDLLKAGAAGDAALALLETLEDTLRIFRRHADARIPDADAQIGALSFGCDTHTP